MIMDEERRHEIDPTSALFAGVNSIWKRVLLFGIAGSFGHFVGYNCYSASDFLARLRTSGLAAFDGIGLEALIWAPFGWIGVLILGCIAFWGVPYMFLLAYALCVVVYGGLEYWHGLAILFIAQPMHTVFVMHLLAYDRTGADTALALTLLAVYEVPLIAAYIWFWRQWNSDS